MPVQTRYTFCRTCGDADGLGHARRHPGINSNRLAGDGPGNIDPLSAMSHLSGIWVRITACR